MYDYVAGKVDWFAAGLPSEGRAAAMTRIGDLVMRDVPTCAPDEKVGDIRGRLGEDSVCLVVNDQRIVQGLVEEENVKADEGRAISEVMHEGPSTLRPNVPAAVLASHVERGAFPWAVVTTPEGELLGILRGADLLRWAENEGKAELEAYAHDGGHT